jgi:serine/threonine-protein kinase HipA
VLDQTSSGDPLGRFVYGQTYLKNPDAVPIDPMELKLSSTTYNTVQLKGVFGALRDAAPDYWGRRAIEKHAAKSILGEMDYLLESPDDRAGALGFGLNKVPPAAPSCARPFESTSTDVNQCATTDVLSHRRGHL